MVCLMEKMTIWEKGRVLLFAQEMNSRTAMQLGSEESNRFPRHILQNGKLCEFICKVLCLVSLFDT